MHELKKGVMSFQKTQILFDFSNNSPPSPLFWPRDLHYDNDLLKRGVLAISVDTDMSHSLKEIPNRSPLFFRITCVHAINFKRGVGGELCRGKKSVWAELCRSMVVLFKTTTTFKCRNSWIIYTILALYRKLTSCIRDRLFFS